MTHPERPDLATLAADVVKTMLATGLAPDPDRLPSLLEDIGAALAKLQGVSTVAVAPQARCREVRPVSETGQQPAVSIRESVTPEAIICLEDGKPMKMLRRYLLRVHGLSPEQYRTKWGLPSDYPLVAPNYAKQKSKYAKRIGLGTHRMREEVAARRQLAAA